MSTNSTKYLFVGGVTPKEKHSEAISKSKTPPQFAAENFQWSFIFGVEKNINSSVKIISTPFYSSFPKNHRDWYISGYKFSHNNNSIDINSGYINLPGIKNIFKFIGLFINTHKYSSKEEVSHIFIYSTNLAYVAAPVCAKLINKKIKLCLIITDLPQHPADCSLSYRLYLKFIEGPVFYRLLNYIDCFVSLTKYIPDALNINTEKCITIEGLFESNNQLHHTDISHLNNDRKIILYTGTLDKRYGADILVDEFKKINNPHIELWICGGGETVELIKNVALSDNRIKYLGIKTRNEIQILQSNATLLINPRTNKGEYNKYSFPSKLMEYMASGTPVLAYKLDGIPDEYYQYIYTVNNDANETLRQAITRVLEIEEIFLRKTGQSAKKFILDNKNSKIQTKRVLDFLASIK